MAEKINWKAVVITFILTGFAATVIVGSFTGIVTWYVAKGKFEAESKKEITKLRNKIMEMQEQLLEQDSGAGTNGSNGSSDTSKWLQYENSRFAFQISYLSDYTAKKSANSGGITLTKGNSKIQVYGVTDNSKTVRKYILKSFPDAVDGKDFSNDEATGTSFWEAGNRYVVFKNRLGDFIVIFGENPDDAGKMTDDIAYTFVPLSE